MLAQGCSSCEESVELCTFRPPAHAAGSSMPLVAARRTHRLLPLGMLAASLAALEPEILRELPACRC